MIDEHELLSELRDRLWYDRRQGALFRKPGFRGVVAGARAGTPDIAGSLEAKIIDRRYMVARLVWLLETGSLPIGCLYRLNGDPGDDRFGNLSSTPPNRRVYGPKAPKYSACKKHGRVFLGEKWKAKCPKCAAEQRIARRLTPEQKAARQLAYQRANKHIYREAGRRYWEKNKNDPSFRAGKAARNLLVRVLRALNTDRQGTREEQLGYSAEELRRHIEEQFKPWMNWGNHGKWHIDHIVPVSWFIAQGVTDPTIINSLENLRPLAAKENLAKGATLPREMRS